MMHVAFPFFVAGSDRHPHNVLHERHSSRLPAGDEAPPFQGVGTSPKCDGTDAHRYGQDASRPGGNLPDTLGELSGGKETGYDRHSLPAERQGIHGLVRQPDHFVDCRGIHRKGLVVIL